MKSLSYASLLSVSLILSVPSVVLSHAGHGDEFQATGGIERVKVNPELDPMLGIVVTPIASATDGSYSVLIPVSALVDADGKQLVFVQYENFYEPVEVTTGTTQGELIEITQGLSVGEQLVTQGGLSLYAESRKTQTADTEPSSETTTATTATTATTPTPTDTTHAEADAQGIPHSHDASGNLVTSEEIPQQSSKFPLALVGGIAGGVVVLGGGMGAIALLRNSKS